jgi:phosphoglycolate phosphatase
VRPLLVLWDVDYTLVATDHVGWHLYEVALSQLYGLAMPDGLGSMAGRTDTSIALEVLAAAGLPEPAAEVPRFQSLMAELSPGLHSMVAKNGRVLPGVAEALTAVAREADGDRLVVQSLLTGNIQELARVKVGALGLIEHLDLAAGAYGDISPFRADLVPVARENAARHYGADFSGRSTVLIGDTPSDIEAAAVSGARSVGVATGRFTTEHLGAAGADIVFADLSGTEAVVAAVLGG